MSPLKEMAYEIVLKEGLQIYIYPSITNIDSYYVIKVHIKWFVKPDVFAYIYYNFLCSIRLTTLFMDKSVISISHDL